MSNRIAEDGLRTLVQAEAWQKICPEKPETCTGVVSFAEEDVRCPAANTTCPYRAEREVEARAQYLLDIGFPPDTARPEIDQVPADIRGTVELYLAHIDLWIERGEGMFLLGNVGAGKTCAMALAALGARDAGIHSVTFVPAWKLFEDLFAKHREPYMETGLLLIDDYDTQYKAEWSESGFHTVATHRLDYRLPMCLTTNSDSVTLAADPRLERVVSRLQRRNNWLETKASSQRRVLTREDWIVEENDSEAEALHRQDLAEEGE